MLNKIEVLYGWLKRQPKGPIKDDDDGSLSWLLADAWHEFDGHDAEGTDSSKISGRVDKPYWADPVLTFDNERHGAFCQGSSQATINQWAVDLQRKTAAIGGQRHRQMTPESPRFDERPVAREIVEASITWD